MRTRRVFVTAALIGLAALLAGCATTAATSPTESPAASADQPTLEPTAPGTADGLEIEAGWIDNGHLIGVVTYGSSVCVPTAVDVTVTATGVAVTLSDGEPRPCTMDYVPRVSLVAVPDGVDVTKPVSISVVYNELTAEREVPATTAPVGSQVDFEPAAAYIGANTIGLVTYGSSTCPPTVSDVVEEGDVLVVTFATPDAAQPCTSDLVPRVITIGAQPGVKTITMIAQDPTATSVDVAVHN